MLQIRCPGAATQQSVKNAFVARFAQQKDLFVEISQTAPEKFTIKLSLASTDHGQGPEALETS